MTTKAVDLHGVKARLASVKLLGHSPVTSDAKGAVRATAAKIGVKTGPATKPVDRR